MDEQTEPYSPKILRFAGSAVATLAADGELTREESATWDAWRDGPVPRQDAKGYVPVPAEASRLFRRALAREANRLEAALAMHDDPDDGNDLAMIRGFLTPRST